MHARQYTREKQCQAPPYKYHPAYLSDYKGKPDYTRDWRFIWYHLTSKKQSPYIPQNWQPEIIPPPIWWTASPHPVSGLFQRADNGILLLYAVSYVLCFCLAPGNFKLNEQGFLLTISRFDFYFWYKLVPNAFSSAFRPISARLIPSVFHLRDVIVKGFTLCNQTTGSIALPFLHSCRASPPHFFIGR